MPLPVHRRHGISDEVWEKLEPLLPGRAGSWGGVAQDNRRFISSQRIEKSGLSMIRHLIEMPFAILDAFPFGLQSRSYTPWNTNIFLIS